MSQTPDSASPIPASPNPAQIPPLPRPRKRWVTVAVVLGIFALGMVVGGAATAMVVVHRIRYALHHPEELPPRLASQIRWKLSLSRDQEADVARIIGEHQKNLQALRREVQPRIEAELRSVESDVAKVLNDAQRRKWDAMFEGLMRDWVPPAPAKRDRTPDSRNDAGNDPS